MYFKIQVTCGLCKCVFELSPHKFKDREAFSCPNCGQVLNEKIASHLRAGLNEFAQIPNSVYKEDKRGDIFGTVLKNALFSFEIPTTASKDSSSFDEVVERMEEDKKLNHAYQQDGEESKLQ